MSEIYEKVGNDTIKVTKTDVVELLFIFDDLTNKLNDKLEQKLTLDNYYLENKTSLDQEIQLLNDRIAAAKSLGIAVKPSGG